MAKIHFYGQTPGLRENPYAQHTVHYMSCVPKKNITISSFIEQGGQLTFRRWLPNIIHEQWTLLRSKIMNLQLSESPDKITWSWAKNDTFSVKSTYEYLTKAETGDPYTRIWKSKIPYKIKIFLWLLERRATLTKDNMLKRKWTGDPTCRFCDEIETTDHLFFQCPIARVVWSITAHCIGANNIPINIDQYWKDE